MLRRTARSSPSRRFITSSWAIGLSNRSVTQCPSFDASGTTCNSVWHKSLAVRRGLSTAADNAKPQAPSKREIYFPTEEELENEKEKSAKLSGVKPAGKTFRWYNKVSIAPHKEEWLILLDGRTIRTPGEHRLSVPSKMLAMAIAAEWESQTKGIKPDQMPLLKLATTALDRLMHGGELVRHALILQLLEYLETDQVCYRVEDEYDPLQQKQADVLDPLLKWFHSEFKVELIVNYGVMPCQQPEETLHRLRYFLHNCSNWELAGLDSLVTITKSLVLALAVMRRRCTLPEVLYATNLDELDQMSRWGEIKGHHDVSLAEIEKNLSAACLYMLCCPLRPLQAKNE